MVYKFRKNVKPSKAVKEIRKEKILMDKDEMTNEDFLKYLVDNYSVEDRCRMAAQGSFLAEILSDDPCGKVRFTVAKYGYCLDKIAHDENPDVRIALAHHGIMLDVLVNDPEVAIRYEVSRHGVHYDKLINDENQFVRDMAKHPDRPFARIIESISKMMDDIINDKKESY